MLRIIFYIVVLFILPQTLVATHIVGGEMTYQCMGFDAATNEYTYQVQLTIYLDCGPNNELGTSFDEIASVGIFQNDVLYEEIFVNYPGFFTAIDTEVNDSCATTPSDACVEKATYVSTINLNFDDGAFDIIYQRCCRNSSISNLVNPNEMGITLGVHIPVPEDGLCNSSPYFNQLPPAFVCAEAEMTLDFSATDPDGDQLVYNLCTPVIGGSQGDPAPSPPYNPPYSQVSWLSGYSESSPFGSDSPVSLDPATGILTGTPLLSGIYSIGICVSEYRNGVLLSTIIRDYQVFVFDCPRPLALFSEQNTTQFCEGLEIYFENGSLNSQTYFWDFGVQLVDSDTTNEFEPTFLFPETGTYEVMLVAEPYGSCADTAWQTYYVQPPVDIEIDFSGPFCSDGNTFSFSPVGEIEGGEFAWNFGNGNMSAETYPTNIFFPNSGLNQISLFYSINGCIGVAEMDLLIDPEIVAIISPQVDRCEGFEINLFNQSLYANDFIWTVSNDDFQAVYTDTNLLVQVPDQGDYLVSLIALNGDACQIQQK